MQKRFTVRDGVLYSLVVVLILLLILLMYQVDRQWSKLEQMQVSLAEQAQDLRGLRTALSSTQWSPISAQPTSTESSGVSPAFQRAKEATLLPDYSQGDWSVGTFELNLSTLTPLVSTDAYSSSVQYFVFESLLKMNPETMDWQGFIAKSWQISEDGLVITFQLREDVSFSDGVPLTAEDVVFSFNLIMNEKINAPAMRSVMSQIESVTAKGKYEVVFTFSEPSYRALTLAGGMDIFPKHFYEPYLQNPQDFNESKGLLLGSGPYRLKDPKNWTPDQGSVELVRNERYWGDVQPTYDRLLWKIIQNASARLTTYRNGEIDSYEPKPLEYNDLKNDPQITAKSQNFEYMPPGAPYYYIGWNQQRMGKPTRFADKRVRLAMTYLTDVERIISDVYLNYAEPAISPFGSASKQHDATLKPYSFDLEKAKQLLKEAGYEDRNQDGVIENAAGEPFEFELLYREADDVRKSIILLLKDSYAKAGIKMIPSPQEWPVLLDAVKKRDFEAATLGWGGVLESDLYQIFHSSQVGEGDNYVSYSNPDLDKVIETARRTTDEATRMPLWQQAERYIYEDQPYTFLVRPKTLVFIDKRIHNLEMTKLGLSYGALPMEEYVPRAMQKYTQP